MANVRSTILRRAAAFAAGLLILKVTVAVILGYQNYCPPNFSSDFLRGRASYFWDRYAWAFYPHLFSGPFSLVAGLILLSERFRLRFPKWHRYLGRIQVPCTLLVVAPSGLWLAYYAQAGTVAAIGFAVLAVLTGATAALGWCAVMQRRFAIHRRWMWRCFLLLSSAVLLRVLGGFATATEFYLPWFDSVAAWASWIIPLAGYELINSRRHPRPSPNAVSVAVTSDFR